MYNFVFSIPVHERFEVVVDQIINIKHYNSNCAIVLHISPVFDYKNSKISKTTFERSIELLGDVYINPISVRTGFADIIQAHIANYNFIKNHLDFEYFSMLSSNELFVKAGLYDSTDSCDCCVTLKPLSKNNNKSKYALSDPDLKKFLSSFPREEIKNSQIEGSYYKKELFARICEIISGFYDYQRMVVAYPREEIYFSTVLSCMISLDAKIVRKSKAFTYINWENGLQIRISDIKRIRKTSDNIRFSVKRVDRHMDNLQRLYILYTSGYYRQERIYNNGFSNILLFKALYFYAKVYFQSIYVRIFK